ncbi:MAG: hypothetical protein COA79_15130 [Planctomycetota bacterium]|nr:MAG: hypothetical protein COA79_15130 [Planctomycetota bacterium]
MKNSLILGIFTIALCIVGVADDGKIIDKNTENVKVSKEKIPEENKNNEEVILKNGYPEIEKEDLKNISLSIPDYFNLRHKFNLYFDVDYTYMEEMPMVMPTGVGMEMAKMKLFSQSHLNLIYDVIGGPVRGHVNFEVLNSFSAGDNENLEGGETNVSLLELYGEYSANDSINIRVGKFLAPFGLFNDIRYITPLYASVVLPLTYLAPRNYGGDKFYPPFANLMISGQFYVGDDFEFNYAMYYGSGDKTQKELTLDEHAAFGAHIKLMFQEKFSIGFSGYSYDIDGYGRRSMVMGAGMMMNDTMMDDMGAMSMRSSKHIDSASGRYVMSGNEVSFAVNTELKFLDDDLIFMGEFAKSSYSDIDDRFTFSFKTQYNINRYTPYFMIDGLKDDASMLYKNFMLRYGLGLSIRFTNNIYFKNEFHYHTFKDDDLPDNVKEAADSQIMFRTSLIFVF